jgi:FkbM family methyltransferase
MHVELLMVGAHNGSKQKHAILDAARRGNVILLEPIPYLFDQLAQTFAGIDNIHLERKCVAETAGKVAFFAPSPEANTIAGWGDQLGSMNPDHARLVNPAFTAHISKIEAESVTFAGLIATYGITSVGTLFTDTEGFDATIIPTFPFTSVMPKHIFFEYKHSDGVWIIGRKFGMLLCFLDMLGYNMLVEDVENCVATRRW